MCQYCLHRSAECQSVPPHCRNCWEHCDCKLQSTPELGSARCTTGTQDVTGAEAVPCSTSNYFFFPLLLFSVETVNDGQFHSVELVMLNQTLNLVVDKGAPKSLGKLQKQSSVSLNTPLYIGGTVSCSRIEVLTCFLRNNHLPSYGESSQAAP